MSLINQVKLSMAKALQFSTDSNIFEIPECTVLMTSDKISIKVASITQIIKTIVDFTERNNANFNIRFLIRDEHKNKKSIMVADLISGSGYEVRNMFGARVMDIKIPTSNEASIGRIVHPLSATIYNVLYNGGETNAQRFKIQQLASDQSIINLEKSSELLSIYTILKRIGLLDTDCAYRFRNPDGTEVARVYPKLVLNGRTLIIRYERASLRAEMRAVILGASLMLILLEVYPDIHDVLAASNVIAESEEEDA
ncbi:unnamed protein product [Thelazia callipaeda]|uniref:Checkpoint protein n=1 Tax=Thelazia callipaeda TaxID=103827 RepID=A0A0N5CRB2_THECL|nr:unnamed protein product [Thelazia callipaeda]